MEGGWREEGGGRRRRRRRWERKGNTEPSPGGEDENIAIAKNMNMPNSRQIFNMYKPSFTD